MIGVVRHIRTAFVQVILPLALAVAAVALSGWRGGAEPPDSAGNTMCPVMTDQPVDPDVFVDHEGTRIHFCCAKCQAKFIADPGAYLGNLPASPRAAARDVHLTVGVNHDEQSAEAINALLFATDPLERFTLRRQIRLAQLPDPPTVPETTMQGLNEIDSFIIHSWERAGLAEADAPPPVCDDATYLRRVYLDIIGRIPTLEESERFLSDVHADKREQLVDELLARDQDYADHWTAWWEDALGSSITGGVNAGMATRGNYTQWINEAFRDNRPFDLFAAQLLDPTLPGHKPALAGSDNGRPVRIHFVLNETHTDTLQTAAAVAQVFMGTAMKCASCHNHFENPEWPQKRFLSFASMFSANDLEVIRCERRTGDVAEAMFPFEIPGAPADMPATVDERLTRIAQLLVDPLNERFAKSIVNRLWKRYTGLGLFEPADDFRSDVSPSHPELLEWLAQDLMRHQYDIKRTIRLILTSRTYQLEYDPALADSFDVGNPAAPRYFRSPSLRRLTAEQLLDSIRTAMHQRLDSAERTFRMTASTGLTRALGKPAVRNDIATQRSDEPAILQGLELLNGDEYQRITRNGRLVGEVLECATPQAAAEMIFRAALSRPPHEDEMQAISSYLTPNWHAQAANDDAKETVWIDDDFPAGAMPTPSWSWIENESKPFAFSGTRAHTQSGSTEPRAQHYVLGARDAMTVGENDLLFVDVFVHAANPPREIMLQWNDGGPMDGGWTHRAYWGADEIPYGASGTDSRRRIGDLPRAGEWVRLEIPASEVGLGTSEAKVVGMSFDQAGGAVWWDRAGVIAQPVPPATTDLHDVLWALFTSPEFQFIR